MGNGPTVPSLRVAMDHCDAPEVQRHLDSDVGDTNEAHSWMQKRFASLDLDTQSAYIDHVIRAVRYSKVKGSMRQQFRVWLLLPRKYKLSARQITDFHAMIVSSRTNTWCEWLTTCYR